MTQRGQRGSKVICVAGRADEFPPAVVEWLSTCGIPATESPDVYDALATLAGGAAPLALIVSLESVDFGELDFFSHAHRLSPETLIVAAGAEHQDAKLEAALGRGARRFHADVLNELLSAAPPPVRAAGPAGLLAGSLRTDVDTPAPPRLVRPEAMPEPPPEAGSGGIAIEEGAETQEPPPVRLIGSTEREAEAAVPFPWSPAQNRPQRTPPKGGRSSRPAEPAESAPAAERRGPVKLTPDELAALLETPPANPQRQEGGA